MVATSKLKMRKKRGQSTLEYIILLTTVVSAFGLAANRCIGPSVVGALCNAAKTIETASARLPK